MIPVIIRNAVAGRPIPIYGDGKNIRDWLYVADHCNAIRQVYARGRAGETYNIGGDCERTNNQIAQTVCTILDELRPREDGKSYREQIAYVEDRPGHDRRYAIDAGKIRGELGWRADTSFEAGIRETVRWYLRKYGGGR